EEGEHVEVAVALGGLRPEFTGDLDDRLDAQTVYLNGVYRIAAGVQSVDVLLAVKVVGDLAESAADSGKLVVLLKKGLGPFGRSFHDVPALAVAQGVGQGLRGVADHLVGLALVHFERTDLVDELVEDVAEVKGVQHAHAEIDAKLEARLAAGGLDAVGLLEQQ